MSESLTERQNFLLGTVAAFIEGIILQPTLYWKNARAQKLPFTLDPRLLYRGTGASIFNECQMMGLQFGFTKFYQDLLRDLNHRPTASSPASIKVTQNEEFLSASLSGVTVGLFSCPVELIMIQQQLHGGSFLGTPVRIFQRYGIFRKGLMRAYSVCALRDAIYVCGMLGITPVLQDYFIEKHHYSMSQASFFASLIGGAFAAIPSHPFDVVKTCMQGDLEQNTYKNVRQASKKLFRERRLFHGCFWRTVNIVATVYIANECINLMSPFFSKIHLG